MTQSPKDKSLKYDINPEFADRVLEKNRQQNAQNNPSGNRGGNRRSGRH
ncbi:hypothetical protein [Paenibacillus sp. NPDC058071]